MFGKPKSKTYISGGVAILILLFVAGVLVLAACAPAPTPPPAPTQDPAVMQTEIAKTVIAELTVNAPTPTAVPPTPVPPTATAVPTAVPPPPGPTPDPNLPVAILPTPTGSQPSAFANLNTTIYGGPGVNYVVYGAFLGGRSAVIVGRSEDSRWWAVSVPVAPLGNGWVDAGFVTALNVGSVPVLPSPPVPPTVEIVPPGANDPQAVTLSNTFVRTGPGQNFPAYGIAPGGTTARVIGRSEDNLWWVVRINPARVGVGFGWAQQSFTYAANVADVPIVQSPPGTVQEAPPPPPPSGAATGTSTDFLNIRSGPGTNFPVMVVAPPGTTGEITGRSSDGAWWQFKVATTYSPSGLGWAMASFVIASNTGSVPVVAGPPAPPSVPAVPPINNGGQCALVSQTPADGTVFSAGAPFNTTWVLRNTGTVTWDMNEYDVAYMGAYNGVQIHTGPDRFDFEYHVPVGSTYSFTAPMIAPSTAGTYGEMWSIAKGSTTICQFYVYINVP